MYYSCQIFESSIILTIVIILAVKLLVRSMLVNVLVSISSGIGNKLAQNTFLLCLNQLAEKVIGEVHSVCSKSLLNKLKLSLSEILAFFSKYDLSTKYPLMMKVFFLINILN